ncbi:MAG: hypothetical protein HQ513_00435 [Rhodospirillales bacterium]|nr:hypothetical protein [Rhodospirillales bacterium]
MKKFDDEILMAYVDSELTPEERKEVELFLAADQGARETVERYRKTRAAIDQFAAVLDEPVPGHLIDTIARHDRQATVVKLPARTNRWLAIAASLVIGVGLGGLTMNYLVVQPSENVASATAHKMAELSKTLEMMKLEKEGAEKNVVAAQKTIAVAKSRIDEMTKALEIAQGEIDKAQIQVLAANREKPKDPRAEGIENIFPYKLVSQAIENGSKLSADMQKSILSELNKEAPAISKASSFSKLIQKSSEGGLTTEASQYESLSDLQPAETKTSEQTEMSDTTTMDSLEPKQVKTILGEFSYSGKTCRLFEYEHRPQAKVSTLIACRNDSGHWQIIRSR